MYYEALRFIPGFFDLFLSIVKALVAGLAAKAVVYEKKHGFVFLLVRCLGVLFFLSCFRFWVRRLFFLFRVFVGAGLFFFACGVLCACLAFVAREVFCRPLWVFLVRVFSGASFFGPRGVCARGGSI